MSWQAEFGEEYRIPEEVLALVASGEAEDISSHNDSAPAFERRLPFGRTVRLWVEHPDRKKREFDRDKRFLVSVYHNLGGDPSRDILETDSVGAAIRAFREQVAKYSPQGGRK